MMVQHKQYIQGSDLLLIYIDILKESKDPNALGTLIDLFGLFPTEENISEPVKAAIRYADTLEKSPEVSQSRASLMNLKATRAWIKENYAESLKAFLESNSPAEFVDMLSDWTSKALPSETDLIISRAVLLLLVRGNLKEANEVFSAFSNNFYQSDSSRTPLINFIRFLLLTLERDAYPLFEKLNDAYAPSIARDPEFSSLLTKIAEVFFNVKPQAPNNFLGQMLKSFLGRE